MKLENKDTSESARFYRLLLPTAMTLLVESVLSIVALSFFLFQNWELFNSVKTTTGFNEHFSKTISKIDYYISNTRYGSVIATLVVWSLIGMITYVIVVKTLLYAAAIWRSDYEKKHYVFPNWYSGKSLRRDKFMLFMQWVLVHVLATTLLLFSLSVVIPSAISYAHIAAYDGPQLYVGIIALLVMLFGIRLVAISVCLFSKKVRSWYL